MGLEVLINRTGETKRKRKFAELFYATLWGPQVSAAITQCFTDETSIGQM